MLDRAMPEPVLDRAGVGAGIGQGVAAAVPQHVEVCWQLELGALADGLHKPVDGICRERRAALGCEDEAAVRVFLSKSRQHAQLVTADRMNARLAVLGPPDMQGGRSTKLHLAPFQL